MRRIVRSRGFRRRRTSMPSRTGTRCGGVRRDRDSWSARPCWARICSCSPPPAVEGIPAHIVLPFAMPRFLETSVATCGAAWEQRFTELVAGADVEILDEHEDDDVYRRTNAALVARRAALAQPGEEIVVLVVRPPEGDAPSMSDDLAVRLLRVRDTR